MVSRRRISQIVVVEGHTDSNRLKKLFDVDTIETNGSAISQEIINLIKVANEKRGVILFLDPDGPGEKIRKIISNNLTHFQNAYISKKDIQTGSKKIGVAEATDDAILKAFESIKTFDKSLSTMNWEQYIALSLNTRKKRKIITDYFKIHECNNKQLFKCLNMMGITYNEILEILDGK